LTQRFVGSFDTVLQTIVNVDAGKQSRYLVHDAGFSYGKNWAPFVFNDELYVIHSFGPLRILKDNRVWKTVENPVVPQVNYSGGRPFSMFRGGTNGLQVSPDVVIGFGHATIYQPLMHTLTFWRMNFSKMTFEMAVFKGCEIKRVPPLGINDSRVTELRRYKPVFPLADPTSLWMEDGKMHLSVFESSTGWFELHCDTATRIYTMSTEDCVTWDMTAWKYYTCLSLSSEK
jgi:hypothetical protein